MAKKIYKTAQGKVVDLGALMLQNENVRAVGNMKVNARGDLVDGWNRPIDRRNNQVQKQYDRQVTNVKDEPVVSAMPTTTQSDTAKSKSNKEPKLTRITAKTEEPPMVTQPEPVTTQAPAESQGLAAAIARARAIRNEEIPPSALTGKSPTVKRI